MQVAIFDMDGLLIDSEPFWRKAETKVFCRLGLPMTEEMCFQTTGLRIDEVVSYWYERYPWSGHDHGQVARDIVSEVKKQIRESGQAMPGALNALSLIKSAGLRIALASSSSMDLIEAVVEHLQIAHYFDVICSAADEEKGKPDPAVYLSAVAKMNAKASECFALEDSFNGIKAAKAAGLKVIAVPMPEEQGDPKFELADMRLGSLDEFDEASWQALIA